MLLANQHARRLFPQYQGLADYTLRVIDGPIRAEHQTENPP